MEILLASIVTILTEAVKWLYQKIDNKKLADSLVILTTFVLSLIASIAYFAVKDKLNWEIIAVIWGSSIAIYELLLKRILTPVIGVIFRKQ
jgi:hypothetical protein